MPWSLPDPWTKSSKGSRLGFGHRRVKRQCMHRVLLTMSGRSTVLEVQPGTPLRDALLAAGSSPHNGRSRWLNCHGFGTCGTCAVQVEGEVAPPSARERARLQFPPHTLASGLRLACQLRVTADLVVTKHPGFWGQDVPPRPDGTATSATSRVEE